VDTEETIQTNSKKKFLIIAIVAALVVLSIVGSQYYTRALPTEVSDTPRTTKEQTEVEKLLIVQSEELDTLRAQKQQQDGIQPTTTIQKQVKALDTLRNQAGAIIQKTTAQQSKELDALRQPTIN